MASYTEDLELRLLKVEREYEALKAAGRQAVTRWVITSAEWYTPRLHFFERERQRRGDVLANAPRGGTYFRFGLTADDRVVVEECYQGGTLAYEAFVQYTPDKLEAIRFSKAHPVFIAQMEYVGGLPSVYRHYGAELRVMQRQTATLRARETYTHWDERRTTIKVEDGRHSLEYEVIYTPEREIERIDIATVFPPAMNTVYRGAFARTVGAGKHDKYQAVVTSIVEAVAREQVDEPVCGLMVNYGWDSWFPPLIVLLYEADRAAYLVDNPPNVELVWNAEAITRGQTHYVELYHALDVWGDLEESLPDQDEDTPYQAARQILADIARELMLVDWTGKLPITDDFVAFSMNYEDDTAQERLAASVPQEKLDLLRERGLW